MDTALYLGLFLAAIVTALSLRQKKEKSTQIDTLKTLIAEIIATHHRRNAAEMLPGECRKVGTLAIGRVEAVVSSVTAADTHLYMDELREKLTRFRESYQGEDMSLWECEVSNGIGYAGSVINDILYCLKSYE